MGLVEGRLLTSCIDRGVIQLVWMVLKAYASQNQVVSLRNDDFKIKPPILLN